GKPVLNVGDNGAASRLRGTLPFDDEGTPTQDTALIKDGILVGRLHSRETAAAMGERPTGNARAISFRHPPIVRMTNTYIAGAPGGGGFEDLIGDVKLGVYACGAFGGQTMLENFSFTAAYGRMIRDGRVAELVKDVVLAGNLFQTLDRIDHIAADFRWTQMGGGWGSGDLRRGAATEGRSMLRPYWIAPWHRPSWARHWTSSFPGPRPPRRRCPPSRRSSTGRRMRPSST